jgi:hypothetical protein
VQVLLPVQLQVAAAAADTPPGTAGSSCLTFLVSWFVTVQNCLSWAEEEVVRDDEGSDWATDLDSPDKRNMQISLPLILPKE